MAFDRAPNDEAKEAIPSDLDSLTPEHRLGRKYHNESTFNANDNQSPHLIHKSFDSVQKVVNLGICVRCQHGRRIKGACLRLADEGHERDMIPSSYTVKISQQLEEEKIPG